MTDDHMVEALRQEIREDGHQTRLALGDVTDRLAQVEGLTRQGYEMAVTNQRRIDLSVKRINTIEARHEREDGARRVWRVVIGAGWGIVMLGIGWILTRLGAGQ